MSKPIVFAAFPKDKYYTIDDSFKEKFDVEYWENIFLTKQDLLKHVKGKFAILIDVVNVPIDEEVFHASGGSLRVVSSCTAGYDHLDVKALKKLGVRIGIAGRAVTEPTAEAGITLLLITARRILEYCAAYRCEEQKLQIANVIEKYQGGLENSVVGIIGCGRIGTSVARKVKGFNISRLLYFSRSEKPEVRAIGGELRTVEEIVRESDFIVLTLELNKDTKHIISRRMIGLMKPTSVIVNIGRAGLIDQDALIEALQKNKIRGAGLDVTDPKILPIDHPLLKLDNVVATPHIASFTAEMFRKMSKICTDNIIAVLDGVAMPGDGEEL